MKLPFSADFVTLPATSEPIRLFPSLTSNPSSVLLALVLLSELHLSSEHRSWAPFDPVGEQAVETAHAAGHSSAQSSFFNPRLQKNIVYHYDLTKMQQVKTCSTIIAVHHVQFLRANLCVSVWLCACVGSLSSN